jgi:hypothetical protein
MSSHRRDTRSEYMEWAKARAHARFNLAASGLPAYPLAELPVRIADLEICGPSGYGFAPLQERLARKCGVAAECVVAATGTSMANHLAMAALVEPGDEVLIEQPTYELLLSAATYLGADIRRFPRRFEDGFRVDAREVERAITPRTRLVVLTNLHNPSGVRADEATLRLVGEIARRHGAQVLVDEVYLEAVFEPGVRSAFHLGDNFLVTSSLTKAYGLGGLRCGWVLAAPPLAERMWRLNDLFGVNPAHPAELLSVIALDHLEKIAARAQKLLAANQAQLGKFLDSRRDLTAVRPKAGTIAFPRLASGNVDRLCALLRERYETTVVPGRFFEMPDHFRLGIAGDPVMVAGGLERLGAALDEVAALAAR